MTQQSFMKDYMVFRVGQILTTWKKKELVINVEDFEDKYSCEMHVRITKIELSKWWLIRMIQILYFNIKSYLKNI